VLCWGTVTKSYFDACELTDLMGVKAIEMLDKAKK